MTNRTTGLLREGGVPGFSSEEGVLSRERWGEGGGQLGGGEDPGPVAAPSGESWVSGCSRALKRWQFADSHQLDNVSLSPSLTLTRTLPLSPSHTNHVPCILSHCNTSLSDV